VEQAVKMLILGAGGHGQTVTDALLRIAETDPKTSIVGFLDDTPELLNWCYQGVRVLGRLGDVSQVPHDGVIVAIGDNRVRRDLYLRLKVEGIDFATVVHPTAVIARDVEIGPGCYIGANAVVGVATWIGANAIVNGAGCLGHHNRIGDHVHIGPGVHSTRDVRIGEGAQIGVGANIISGRTIGAWSLVGAGSLVSRDIPDAVVAYGMPARVIRSLQAGAESVSAARSTR
jgi:sugar O-acyltransferase (sialic acid O-acetyltransferase NeuD family)